jgi:hypothetical protein
MSLPKWPGLLVVGDPVTPTQAGEILIRTDDLNLLCNDRAWTLKANKMFGFPHDPYSRQPIPWEELQRLRKQVYQQIELTYLCNHQIADCWVGGVHGWCDWHGNIGCHTYNIGKWPTIEEVEDDWKAIAKAFPFLRLKSQLLADEISEEVAHHPVVEYDVCDGCVTTNMHPTELLVKVNGRTADDLMAMVECRSERPSLENTVQLQAAINRMKHVYESR